MGSLSIEELGQRQTFGLKSASPARPHFNFRLVPVGHSGCPWGTRRECLPAYRQRGDVVVPSYLALALLCDTYRLCSYSLPKFDAVRRTCSVICIASVGCNNAFVGVFSYRWLYGTAPLFACYNRLRKRTPNVSSHAAYLLPLRALPIRMLPTIQMRMVESANRSIN